MREKQGGLPRRTQHGVDNTRQTLTYADAGAKARACGERRSIVISEYPGIAREAVRASLPLPRTFFHSEAISSAAHARNRRRDRATALWRQQDRSAGRQARP